MEEEPIVINNSDGDEVISAPWSFSRNGATPSAANSESQDITTPFSEYNKHLKGSGGALAQSPCYRTLPANPKARRYRYIRI